MGQQHISYQALVEKAKWFEEQVRDGSGCRNRHHGGGHQRRRIRREQRPYQRSAETGRGSQVHFGPGDRPSAPQDLRHARRHLFLQNSQDVRIGGRQGNAQYQYTLQAPDFASLALWGPKVLDKLSHAARDCRRQFRPAEFRLVVQRDDRPRYRVAPRPDGAGGGPRALRRFRPAPGLDDVQVDQPVSRGAGAAAAVVGKPGLPEDDLRADAQGHRRSVVDLHALHAGHHADFAAAPGTVPGHHDFVQPGRGRRAERRRDCHQPGGGRDGPARQHHRQVRRHRAGLSGIARRISRS